MAKTVSEMLKILSSLTWDESFVESLEDAFLSGRDPIAIEILKDLALEQTQGDKELAASILSWRMKPRWLHVEGVQGWSQVQAEGDATGMQTWGSIWATGVQSTPYRDNNAYWDRLNRHQEVMSSFYSGTYTARWKIVGFVSVREAPAYPAHPFAQVVPDACYRSGYAFTQDHWEEVRKAPCLEGTWDDPSVRWITYTLNAC